MIQGRVSRGGSQGVLARARALSLSTVSLFGGGSGKGGSAPGRSFGVPSPSFGGSPRSTDLSKFQTVGRKYQCGRARGVFVPCASRTDVGPSDGGFLPVMEGGKGGKGEFGVFSSGSSPGRARSPSVRSPSSEGDRERGDPPLVGPSVSLLPPSEGPRDRPTFRNSGLLGENINVDALAAFSFRVRLARTLVPSMGGFSISWRGEKEKRGNPRSAVSLRDWKAFREYSRGLSASWVPFSLRCGFDRPSPVRAIDAPVIRDGSSLAGSWGPRSFCFRPIAVGPFDAAVALSDPSGKRGGG